MGRVGSGHRSEVYHTPGPSPVESDRSGTPPGARAGSSSGPMVAPQPLWQYAGRTPVRPA